ncbi:AraC family transcriptional regulator [Streptomyces sp. WI04-05B]|uniref:helix-turn-helix transcriptional regulator n=1 Tax=Streptomyces TaxID=1883 RepID=UPI0029BBF9EC|nr:MULTISPECIES: AraC family transcriptional regulator [unclassified Streptomyces]MDX2544833.1 AraC family transcriptional regulator [Streptomyces sp. WI04-05B]MDX2588881.1 AraC family transcriptional regulator [Streptomyces sp. WI04-05A]MDX3750734.1 AraC family transcriptional regulator [Streptomyces sp. AK08-02]
MIGTVFRTDDVPVGDRFDYWQELVGRTRSSALVSTHAADFWAEQRLLELGPVAVSRMSFLPTRYRRTEKLVRQADPEFYHLTLLIEGGLALDHAGRASTFTSRDLHLADSSRPYDVRSADDRQGGIVTGMAVDFPKALLPLPPDRVRELLGRRLPGLEGVGALLADFVVGLDLQADTLQPSDGPRLGTVVLDLMSAWFAQLLEAEASLSPETRGRATAERVQAFIRQNLHDPDLTPPVIAAAHNISLSYLHRIFQERTHGEPVAAWIRRRRLENAHRDLADGSLRTTPIHTIAARWGYPRPSDFTRAFRAAYGTSPREHRQRALAGGE